MYVNNNTERNASVAIASKMVALAALIVALASGALSQQPAAPGPTADKPAVANESKVGATTPGQGGANPFTTSPSDRYRIGPGDVLDIRILNREKLSRDNVRVEGNGTIRMPLIDGDILAACLTEGDLEKEITKRYLKYY